ncbi:hypothetical protein MXB_2530, partial [Myxobolus squamalis]
MVIDINILRLDRGGDPNVVLNSEKNRFKGTSNVEKIMEIDQNWRNLRNKLDTFNRHKNSCSKLTGQKIKNKEDVGISGNLPEMDVISLIQEKIENLSINQLKDVSKILDTEISVIKNDLDAVASERDDLLNEVGNILHPSVDENKIEKKVGDCVTRKKNSHVDLLLMIDGADYKRGYAISGNRGYFLKGPGLFIAQALIQYSLRLLNEKGFECLYTPFFMKKNVMRQVAQLNQFDEELYKIVTKSDDPNAGIIEEEKYLIATSEQTIAAYHKDEWLSPDSLPLKYAGLSTCFRQEVGSHGRDTSGIFRVHQFEKVEQFVICSPENNESWSIFEELLGNSEDLCKDLGISYRIVSIVSGALNNAAAKKYDLEAWFPGSGAFRELVSCSNCTDYQSRRLGIRFGCTKQLYKEVKYVHMLNSTMCAVTRVLCCLLETHQTELGIE